MAANRNDITFSLLTSSDEEFEVEVAILCAYFDSTIDAVADNFYDTLPMDLTLILHHGSVIRIE